MSAVLVPRLLYIMAAANEPPASFEEIFAIQDPQAARDGFEMAKLFQRAVQGEGRFDIGLAEQLARNQPGMIFINKLQQRLTQNHDRVSVMADAVNRSLADFMGVALPEVQRRQIETAIAYTFTNLYVQRSDGWIFYSKESAHSTTYQYNILFALQNESTGDYVYGVPLGMTIKVDREYERVLWITLKDEVSYSVQVDALKVGVPMAARIEERVERRLAELLAA